MELLCPTYFRNTACGAISHLFFNDHRFIDLPSQVKQTARGRGREGGGFNARLAVAPLTSEGKDHRLSSQS